MSTLRVMMAVVDIRQREVAARLGASDQEISLWVNDKRKIPLKYIAPLAAILGVTDAEMLAVAARGGAK